MRYASFNQDASCVTTCTDRGLHIYRCDSHACCYADGSKDARVAELLFSTSLLVLVGTDTSRNQGGRRMEVIDTNRRKTIKEINVPKEVLAVRMNRSRLVAVMETSVSVYELADLSHLKTIKTSKNRLGVCALSPNSSQCHLALPCAESHGELVVYNLADIQITCSFAAHKAPLCSLAMDSDGNLLASASTSGTVIRVHHVSTCKKVFTFRRGSHSSRILSLSFGPQGMQVPFLAALSERGTVHVFSLNAQESSPTKRNVAGRAGAILATVLPSMSDIVVQSRSISTIRVPLCGEKAICCIRATCAERVGEGEEVSREVSAGALHTSCGDIRILVVTTSGILYDYLLENIQDSENMKCTLQKETILAELLWETTTPEKSKGKK